MKFSTILTTGDAFEILPSATFHHSIASQNQCLYPQLDVPAVYTVNSRNIRKAGAVRISNDLLYSSDIQHHENSLVTISKAAARVGEKAIFVPESEAARCETQRPAHAVWIPDRFTYSSPYYDGGPIVEMMAGENPELARRIIMPGLAILAENDVLDVRVVDFGRRGAETPKVLHTFKVGFDGTNLKVDGVRTELMSQECFV